MAAPAYTVEPLASQHERGAFACGVAALDRYLHQQARQDAEKRVAAPFVVLHPPDKRVLGYYTLSASVIALDALPDELARKLPRYPQLPVTRIGRLAVDRTARGLGLGEHLLLDALHRSLTHADQIAAMAVVVDAKDEATTAFYRHYGFAVLQDQPMRMHLPMRTVERLLG